MCSAKSATGCKTLELRARNQSERGNLSVTVSALEESEVGTDVADVFLQLLL